MLRRSTTSLLDIIFGEEKYLSKMRDCVVDGVQVQISQSRTRVLRQRVASVVKNIFF